MALTGTGNSWGDAITDAILAANPDAGDLTAGEQSLIRGYWRLICGEHVSHIVTNTDVTPGSFQAGSDPVTGTGGLT